MKLINYKYVIVFILISIILGSIPAFANQKKSEKIYYNQTIEQYQPIRNAQTSQGSAYTDDDKYIFTAFKNSDRSMGIEWINLVNKKKGVLNGNLGEYNEGVLGHANQLTYVKKIKRNEFLLLASRTTKPGIIILSVDLNKNIVKPYSHTIQFKTEKHHKLNAVTSIQILNYGKNRTTANLLISTGGTLYKGRISLCDKHQKVNVKHIASMHRNKMKKYVENILIGKIGKIKQFVGQSDVWYRNHYYKTWWVNSNVAVVVEYKLDYSKKMKLVPTNRIWYSKSNEFQRYEIEGLHWNNKNELIANISTRKVKGHYDNFIIKINLPIK